MNFYERIDIFVENYTGVALHLFFTGVAVALLEIWFPLTSVGLASFIGALLLILILIYSVIPSFFSKEDWGKPYVKKIYGQFGEECLAGIISQRILWSIATGYFLSKTVIWILS